MLFCTFPHRKRCCQKANCGEARPQRMRNVPGQQGKWCGKWINRGGVQRPEIQSSKRLRSRDSTAQPNQDQTTERSERPGSPIAFSSQNRFLPLAAVTASIGIGRIERRHANPSTHPVRQWCNLFSTSATGNHRLSELQRISRSISAKVWLRQDNHDFFARWQSRSTANHRQLYNLRPATS